METNDLKNMWKSEVDKNIKSYSDSELNEIIIKSVRKSIRRIYPSVIFMLVIIAVIIILIVNITVRNATPAMRMLDLGALLLLAVCLTVWGQSFLTMKKYEADVPVKDWLKYRIKAIEKSLNFSIKYNFPVSAVAIFAALGYYYLFIWLSGIFVNLWIIGGVTAGIIIYLLVAQKSSIKQYRKSLEELNKIYKQFED